VAPITCVDADVPPHHLFWIHSPNMNCSCGTFINRASIAGVLAVQAPPAQKEGSAEIGTGDPGRACESVSRRGHCVRDRQTPYAEMIMPVGRSIIAPPIIAWEPAGVAKR
jgi:hypothetical protein